MRVARGLSLLFIYFFAGNSAKADPKICWSVFAPGHAPSRLGVLPVYVAEYSETKPCDSCHRLSENGMEFFLGNALRRIVDTALQKAKPNGPEVELIAPHWELLKSRRVEFPGDLDSLHLPWQPWLAGCEEPVIARPRESMSSRRDRERLAKIAGALGYSHLLVVRDFRVFVKPMSRDTHSGGLRWFWHGALYNADEARFEWAVEFSEDRPSMDLDEDLEIGFAKAFGAALRSLPQTVQELRQREPR